LLGLTLSIFSVYYANIPSLLAYELKWAFLTIESKWTLTKINVNLNSLDNTLVAHLIMRCQLGAKVKAMTIWT